MVSEWYLTECYSEWSNGILNGTYKKLFSFFVNDILNGIPFHLYYGHNSLLARSFSL